MIENIKISSSIKIQHGNETFELIVLSISKTLYGFSVNLSDGYTLIIRNKDFTLKEIYEDCYLMNENQHEYYFDLTITI